MNPQTFARAVVSIESKYGLRIDAADVWLRLDEFKKVKELAGGKCNEAKGWYGLKGACKRGKKGEGEARSKESKVDVANRIRKRKGTEIKEKTANGTAQAAERSGKPKDSTNAKKRQGVMGPKRQGVMGPPELKQSKLLDIESLDVKDQQFDEKGVQSILKSRLQSQMPVVLAKPGSNPLDPETDVFSGNADVANYKEAARRDRTLTGRMHVMIAKDENEAKESSAQQKILDRASIDRKPIKSSQILDIEAFPSKKSGMSKDKIEELAQSIVRNGGLYQGPQVKQTGVESWDTQSKADDFAVEGYRRALKINPELKGRIMAQFV